MDGVSDLVHALGPSRRNNANERCARALEQACDAGADDVLAVGLSRNLRVPTTMRILRFSLCQMDGSRHPFAGSAQLNVVLEGVEKPQLSLVRTAATGRRRRLRHWFFALLNNYILFILYSCCVLFYH